MKIRVNIGCGRTIIPGWHNYDNSISIFLAKMPKFIFKTINIPLRCDYNQQEYINFLRHNTVRYANATKKIPEKNFSVEICYSSHMVEHLSKKEVELFLKEVKRILCPGGILRLAIPDISIIIKKYLQHKDADLFLKNTELINDASTIQMILFGVRHHQYMYDGPSLCKLLKNNGFENVKSMSIGETNIVDPGGLNLEERAEESVYVEATNP